MNNQEINIGDAAKYLGMSIATPRRWDGSKKLTAHRTGGNQRWYLRSELDLVKYGIVQLTKRWVWGEAVEPEQAWYCP